MAMVVKNNAAAIKSLNILDKNAKQLAKSLQQASSGMRINSAGDGASEYSIARKLEVTERSLSQDIDNAKTGGMLTATAEGGIQEIINNLREMKAMALNSANGHNTDSDRATLQKEFSSRIDTITDIAATTNYNGRLLLNGDYSEPVERMEDVATPVTSTKTVHIGPPSVTVLSGTDATGRTVYTIQQDNAVQNLTAAFSPGNTATSVSSNVIAGNTAGTVCRGFSGGTSVDIDFSGVTLKGASVTNYPNDLDKQGFTILCGACDQFVNITFDASKTSSSYVQEMTKGTNDHEYIIGIQGVKNQSDLETALFQGILNAVGKPTESNHPDTATDVLIDPRHSVRIAANSTGTGYVLLKDSSPALCLYDAGTFLAQTTSTPGTGGVPSLGTITVNTGYDTTVTSVSYLHSQELVTSPGNPLIIHTGTKASQHMVVYINSMHPIAMGINQAAVTPWEKALEALGLLDHALEYALNENTRMGAYQDKLLETQENLVTANANTTAAMSTIQDADMAKTITDFTKNNVLTQSAQLMLAQANQSASSVLDLLK